MSLGTIIERMSDDPTPVKPKRVMSELQLEKLKLAREKAHAVKQQMKQISDDEKIKHYEGKIKSIRKKETKEENAIRIIGLDFQILAHHGGKFGHGSLLLLIPIPYQSAIFVGSSSAPQRTDVLLCRLNPRRLDFIFDLKIK